MRWFRKGLAAGTVQAATSHIVAMYILPLGAPVVTVVIGYVSGLPWFWIWLGALAAFAFISHGLLRYAEWRERQRVEGKITLAAPRVVLIHNQGYTLGVQIYNIAAFPIEVELSDLRTQISQKISSGKRQAGKRLVVIPNSTAWFHDNPIQIEVPKPGSVTGSLEATLRYGVPGSDLPYQLKEKKQLTASFDEQGNWAGNALWTDMIED